MDFVFKQDAGSIHHSSPLSGQALSTPSTHLLITTCHITTPKKEETSSSFSASTHNSSTPMINFYPQPPSVRADLGLPLYGKLSFNWE